jgi:hypothetical protein
MRTAIFHRVCPLVAGLASFASHAAVLDCELNGEWVNPVTGFDTSGALAFEAMHENFTLPRLKDDKDSALVRDEQLFEDGSRKSTRAQ